jgi:hypothetical protein
MCFAGAARSEGCSIHMGAIAKRPRTAPRAVPEVEGVFRPVWEGGAGAAPLRRGGSALERASAGVVAGQLGGKAVQSLKSKVGEQRRLG